VHLAAMRGESFDIQAEAHGHAMAVARKLGRNASRGLPTKYVTVMNEQGVVVFKTPIPEPE
jgi:hypothetical protein